MTESGAPDLATLDNRLVIETAIKPLFQENQCILNWPIIGESPINEFTSEGYIAKAFPILFPTGDADLRSPRIHDVTPNQYFKFLMKYKDQRFAKNPRFRFFAMNSLMRWMALSNSKICIRRNHLMKNVENVNDLRQIFQQNTNAYKSVLAFNSNVRSTSSYWYFRSRELIDMVKHLGAPTIFITLSAADLYWSYLSNIFDDNMDEFNLLSEKEQLRRRARLVNENPMNTAYYFKERVEYFFQKILIPSLNIKDY